MTKRQARFATVCAIVFGLLAGLTMNQADAVPSFARQTGQECIACHVSFPELTPYGRYFKLTGYTIGRAPITSQGLNFVPFAVMAQASVTKTRNNNSVDPETGDTVPVNQKDSSGVFCCASVFLASKINDYMGGFIQWSYDNLASKSDGTLGGHSGIDNVDLRVVGTYSSANAAVPDLIYGVTLNNNPTAQDAWNSTPAFGYPYTASPLASTPAAQTQIDGGLAQQVAGLGGYMYWKKNVYGELSFYRTADGAFRSLRAGQDTATDGGVAAVQKWKNPYWRLALTQEWGPHSAMVGTYGMVINRYPSNLDTTTGTDQYRDIAVDAQYQYITDPHTFTTQATYIHEKQSYKTSYAVVRDTGAGVGAGPTPDNATNTLKTAKIKGTYYYQRKYGGTLGYFATTGSADAGLYGTDSAGNSRTPNSRGYNFELDYLPIQNVRLMLQYTAYNKFDGAKTNYDGNGRNASDNNTLFFNIWVAL
jgi:hypothetical protein